MPSGQKKKDFPFHRDPKTDLIILVGIVAIFALVIMFLKFPG